VNIRIRSQVLRNSAARIIQTHLEGMGVDVIRGRVESDAPIVNWGVSGTGQLPSLNENCNWFNKRTALERFNNAGVRAPQPFGLDWEDLKFPFLARKVAHRRGNDILKIENYRQAHEASLTHDFGVPYIPKVAEYRTWVFRDEVIAVYEKKYQGEGKYDGVIWNHQDGLFKFVSLKEANWPKGIMGPSIMAVKSLRLDFGACDVMKDVDGNLWMLEVNTAPHIDGLERNSGKVLAQRMFEWALEFHEEFA
jgi:hypothetical protein